MSILQCQARSKYTAQIKKKTNAEVIQEFLSPEHLTSAEVSFSGNSGH